MYYGVASGTGVRVTALRTPRPLPMTPAVALRRLWEQLDSYRKLAEDGARIEIFRHFPGPISPPTSGRRPPMGDPVFGAVAQYTSILLARAGVLGTQVELNDHNDRVELSRLSRLLFTIEHALAVELEKVAGELSISEREIAARSTLTLASFWLDRSELLDLDSPGAHCLLGIRPTDVFGRTLYDYAVEVLQLP